MTNNYHTVLYTGVTNDLRRRVFEHKQKLVKGFSKAYNVTKLVYYEIAEGAETAIEREKQLKAGSREKKLLLIESFNGEWRDLYDDIL
jgi:putative endonuclease